MPALRAARARAAVGARLDRLVGGGAVSAFELRAPLAGWSLPLAEVPDPVFAERMAGDGVAIDPTEGVVHAPCDGEVVASRLAHAITVRHASGIEVLVHVGVETVALKGEGFVAVAAAGSAVRAGDVLLRFDLDLVARRARSCVSPIILPSGARAVRRVEHRSVSIGDVILEIEAGEAGTARAAGTDEIGRAFSIPFEHGLHVRPAAQLAAALRPFGCDVVIALRGRTANARSTVATMALGVRCGDIVEARARGADAAAALDALAGLLAPPARQSAPLAPALRVIESPRLPREVPGRIAGVIASRGVAIGTVVAWIQPEPEVGEAGRGEAEEGAALEHARMVVRAHLERLAAAAAGERRTLIAAHAELVADPELA